MRLIIATSSQSLGLRDIIFIGHLSICISSGCTHSTQLGGISMARENSQEKNHYTGSDQLEGWSGLVSSERQFLSQRLISGRCTDKDIPPTGLTLSLLNWIDIRMWILENGKQLRSLEFPSPFQVEIQKKIEWKIHHSNFLCPPLLHSLFTSWETETLGCFREHLYLTHCTRQFATACRSISSSWIRSRKMTQVRAMSLFIIYSLKWSLRWVVVGLNIIKSMILV